MRGAVVSGINHRFRWLSQSQGQITHVLLTRSPLEYHRSGLSARLACVKHAASVRPEPGSNSPSKNTTTQPTRSQAATINKSHIPRLNKTSERHPKPESPGHQPESLSKKPRHQPKPMSTGHNKLIRRLIKHTVEFSRIRRTHIAIR